MNPQGQAAIVTGGASGLGAAAASSLRGRGASVAIVDADAERAHEYAAEIGALALTCDVRDGDSAKRAVEAAREAHGPARILVNCAGIGTPGKAVGRDGPLPLEVFSRVIEVNLIGTFNVIRLAASEMQKLDAVDDDERGVIVNTASVAAYDGQIGQVAYSASKGGIHSMTLPVARDLASRGVRVCTIAPGVLLTPLMDVLPEEAQKSLGESVPFPARLGKASEYAELAIHICENDYLNAETIRLDGALRMAAK